MAKYRSKRVVIEAVQLHAVSPNDSGLFNELPQWLADAGRDGILRIGGKSNSDWTFVWIKTSEGEMEAGPDDYIIQGIKGKLYSCKRDIFEQTYELPYEVVHNAG